MTASTPRTDGAPRSAGPRGRPDDLDAVLRLRPSRGVVGSGVVGGLALASGVALTATSGWLIVSASLQPPILTLLVAIVLVRAFGVARPVLRYAERVQSHDRALAELADRRTATYRTLVPLTPARLGRRARTDLLAGVVDDLDDVVNAQVRVVVPVVAMAVAALLGIVVATTMAPVAGLVMGAMLLSALLVGGLDARLEHRVQDRVVGARAAVAAMVGQVATQADDLAAIGAERDVLDRLGAAQQELRRALRGQAVGRAVGTAGLPLLVAGATVAMAVVAAHGIAAGMSTPVAALLVLLPLGLGEAMGGLADAMGWWARAAGARRRLGALLRQEPAVAPPRPSAPAPSPRGTSALALVDVAASWDGRPALRDLSLSVGAAQRVALVGPNGAGKSTALAVLARHLDPTAGRHLVDGRDVRTMSLADVRSRLAVVDDEPHVFASTLRENLRLARPTATDEDCEAALAVAGLRDWAGGLDAGLDTRLGAGGRGVSGGERARLAIARAVLSGRPVWLLDEPVAHLDHPTAVRVLADVLAAAGGGSLVVASHRPEGLDAVDAVVSLSAPAPGPGR